MINAKINFLEGAVDLKLYSTKKNLTRHLEFFFQNTELKGKRVLDIGGGSGLLSYWAIVNGGSSVCLEPEFDGSSKGIKDSFFHLGKNIGMNPSRAEFEAIKFQDYKPNELFDIIVLANSINHLNEDAVQSVTKDKAARKEYIQYFEKMYNLLNDNGILIITDCSRHNFFNLFGMKNPLMPTIEWKKHQSPYYWGKLLNIVGFKKKSIHWSAPNSLGFFGKLVFGNPISSFFTLSHFRLEMKK